MKFSFCDLKKMKFWKWDEAAQKLTLTLSGATLEFSREIVKDSPPFMGGFVASATGFEGTLILGGQSSRVEIKPNRVQSSEP
jgi:hypothetical protein